MPMKDRHLKISEACGHKRKVPRIILQGDWLASLGYHVGVHIKISFQDNQIIIEPEPDVPSPHA